MNDLNGGGAGPQGQHQQPTQQSVQPSQPNDPVHQSFDLTPPRSKLNTSQLGGGGNAKTLLKQVNSPVGGGGMTQQEQQHLMAAAYGSGQSNQQTIGNSASMPSIHQPGMGGQSMLMQGAAALGAQGSAFDQNTYMQLLQRQQQNQQLNRSNTLANSRPLSRGRSGGEIFIQNAQHLGGGGQQMSHPDQSAILSPSATMMASGGQNFTNTSTQQTSLANMQPQLNNFMPTFVSGHLTSRSTSQGAQVPQKPHQNHASNSFLNQTLNGATPTTQIELTSPGQSFLRNQAPPQSHQQAQPNQTLTFEQIQMIAQILQNTNGHQQQAPLHQNQGYPQQTQNPPALDHTHLLQQLLNQQAAQQSQGILHGASAPGMSSRNALSPMPQPNLSMPQMYHSAASTAAATNATHQSFSGAPPTVQASNPQLQQISANVNEYRKLIENYKNSNQLLATHTSTNPSLNTSTVHHQVPHNSGLQSRSASKTGLYQGYSMQHQHQPNQIAQQQQQPPPTPLQEATNQQHLLHSSSHSLDLQSHNASMVVMNRANENQQLAAHPANNSSSSQLQQNTHGLGSGQHADGHGGLNSSSQHIPTYESFMASQQFPAQGGVSQSSGQKNHIVVQHDPETQEEQLSRGGEQHQEGITLVGCRALAQGAASGDKKSAAGQGAGDNSGRIEEQSKEGPNNANISRNMTPFQIEDDHSAFLEGKAILGALSNQQHHHQMPGQQYGGMVGQDRQVALNSSKSFSPIDQREKPTDDGDNCSSSFLRGANDDVVIHDAASHAALDQSREISQNKAQQEAADDIGVMWLSQQPSQQPPQGVAGFKEPQDGKRVDKAERLEFVEDSVELKPKQLFKRDTDESESPVDGQKPDLDAQVIRKQQLTFEQLLENQLLNLGTPESKSYEDPTESGKEQQKEQVAIVENEHVTPIKRDTQASKKKAFLRRGSSSKYDPQQARKQSQGSTKKFKYYTDNFASKQKASKEKVQAAPKGTTGIPSLSITKHSSQQKQEEKSARNMTSPKLNTTNSSSKRAGLSSGRSKKQGLTDRADELARELAKDPLNTTNQGDTSRVMKADISSGRLKPPENSRPQVVPSRLKFNPPSTKNASKKDESDKSRKGGDSKSTDLPTGRFAKGSDKKQDEKKVVPSAMQQKASMARLATSKQLFRKTTANSKSEIKSVEAKEPTQPASSVQGCCDEADTKNSLHSEVPKGLVPFSTDSVSNQTPNIQLESSMLDEREESGASEKNSIAEFEMLEKECFQNNETAEQSPSKINGTKPRKQVNTLDLSKLKDKHPSGRRASQAKREESHETPIKMSARELLNNLKSASTDKLSHAGSEEESKLDRLELQLLGLITEQESEVSRLKEENQRVAVLQSECQKQLERLNKEAGEQDKQKKASAADIKKLKTQLRSKEAEIIKLQENLISSQEQNSKLKSSNQVLSNRLTQIKTRKREATKETQTDKTQTRNVLVGTQLPLCAEAGVQVELLCPDDKVTVLNTVTEEGSTPQKHDESHVTLEDSKSQQVSISGHEDLEVCPDLREPSLSSRQIRVSDDESCEVRESDAARGAEIVRSARSTAHGQQYSSGGGDMMSTKTTKIVTFNLNESMEQKQKIQDMQLLQHTESVASELVQEEEDLGDDQEAAIPQATTEEAEEESQIDEDFDLVFPEEYHSDEAYAGLVQVDEIVSAEGKKQRFFKCGKKEIIFPNGVKREVWPDGYQVVFFQNKDIKQTYPGGKIVYFFNEAKTTQTTYADGLQVFKFQNNQIEKHFPDGTKEISFPDGTIKCLFADGEEESIFPDGTIQKIEKTGMRIIEYSHGQRDYMYPDGTKVREYPNGLIKRYNVDGTVESVEQRDLASDGSRPC